MKRSPVLNFLDTGTEASEMRALFQWRDWNKSRFPELELLFHIVNEGKRGYKAQADFRQQGGRSGLPDVCLPVRRGRYGALYIEMKRRRGGKISAAQTWWLNKLELAGNFCEICYGHEEAESVIVRYLGGEYE